VSTDIAAIVERARAAAASKTTDAASGPGSERSRLQKVAQEFEAMLLTQMLRDMRKAGAWEDEASGDTYGADTMFETLDVELAGHLAHVQGLGLSKQLLQAFDRLNEGSAPTSGLAFPGRLKPAPTPDLGLAPTTDLGLAPTTDLGLAPTTGPGLGPTTDLGRRVPSTDLSAAPTTNLDPLTTNRKPALTTNGVGAGFSRPDEPAAEGLRPRPATVTVPEGKVTSSFGWRHDPFTGQAKFHRGVDLKAAYGQDVPAAGDGRVMFSGTQGGYGTTVLIEHPDGTRTRYAHLSATSVSAGDSVAAGQAVGQAGHSGRATGTHLHFEVIAANGRPVDPRAAARGASSGD
jgi:murein DD-endopeptidase MepM/ murein hydrolase activator NlpD